MYVWAGDTTLPICVLHAQSHAVERRQVREYSFRYYTGEHAGWPVMKL